MSLSLAEKLRNLLSEKFKEDPRFSRVELLPSMPAEKWQIVVRMLPYDLSITAYIDRRIVVDAGPVRTSDAIWDYLDSKNYERRYKEAKTEEEKEKILREELEEEKEILEGFKQRKFEKYLKGPLAWDTRRHMWADEITKRVSHSYGVEVKFEIDFESSFKSSFDSTSMDDEQVISEVLRRTNAIAEAVRMLYDKEAMRRFLKGLE